MKRNRNSALFAAVLLLAVLGGCKKQQPPSAPAASKPQPRPSKQAAAVQGELSSAVRPGARLEFSKRTDPFKPYAAAVPVTPGGEKGAGEKPAAALSDQLPIQSFEVTKFKVVGIVAGLKENRALLIDPNGKAYVVQEGMLIGNNGGRITRITASAVEVVERFMENNGRYKKRKIVLTLAKKR